MNATVFTDSPHIKHLLGVSNLRSMRMHEAITICRGEGVYVFDDSGREYLEACSSFYCAGLGYGCEQEILAAISDQIAKLSFYVSASSRTTDITTEYAEKLASLVPLDDAHILFGCSGSEANDFIMKIIRYRNILKGEPERRKFISRFGGYHGGTIATAALGGDPELQSCFGLDVQDHIYVSQPDFFNCRQANESEPEYASRLADELVEKIERAGPETIAALFLEPVNFSGGFQPPLVGYLARVREIADQYGFLLVADEIVTGFGRTGSFFGSEAVGLSPDCLTLGKSMGAAYFPISAAVIDRNFYDWLELGSEIHGVFGHAGTFSGHPIGAAIGLKVLEIFEERHLLSHIQAMAKKLQSALESLKTHSLVADARSFGLAGAIQLRSSQSHVGVTKSGRGIAAEAMEQCLKQGLIVRVNGPNLIIAPPLIITDTELSDLFDRLSRVLNNLCA